MIQSMHWTLIQLQGFKHMWRVKRLTDEDLQALESSIMRDPAAAPVMRGTGGLRKLRFAPPSRGRGKSGSMRVAYAQFPEHRRIYLVTLFFKKDDDNLSTADHNAIKKVLDRIAADLRKGLNP